MIFDELSNRVIGCAIEVHRELGPGLLASAYEQCLVAELSRAAIPFQVQVDLSVNYKGVQLDCGYRIDLVVDNKLLVELKCIEQLPEDPRSTALTYMKISENQRWTANELQCADFEERD